MKTKTPNSLVAEPVAAYRPGFTLIELLVVISVIGLLSSIVLVAMNSARQRANDAKKVADMNQVIKAMELYFNENSSYPSAAGVFNAANLSGLSKFLITFPVAPQPPDGTYCVNGTPTAEGQNYNAYYYTSNGVEYTITFCLGSSRPANLAPGVHYVTRGGLK